MLLGKEINCKLKTELKFVIAFGKNEMNTANNNNLRVQIAEK